MTPAEETQALAEILLSLVHRLVNEIGTKNHTHLMKRLVEIHESSSLRAIGERERADRLRAAITHAEVPK